MILYVPKRNALHLALSSFKARFPCQTSKLSERVTAEDILSIFHDCVENLCAHMLSLYPYATPATQESGDTFAEIGAEILEVKMKLWLSI